MTRERERVARGFVLAFTLLTSPALASLPVYGPGDPEPLIFTEAQDGRHSYRRIGPQCFTGGKFGGEPVDCADLLLSAGDPFPSVGGVLPPIAATPLPHRHSGLPGHYHASPVHVTTPETPSPVPVPAAGLMMLMALGALGASVARRNQ